MIDQYLNFLGVPRREPSVEYLFELHRAQVSRVPYTNLDIMNGQPGTVDQIESVQRVLAGHGGYCFQVNGALAWLLRGLGFSLTMHRGWVAGHDGVTRELPNHLVLLVHDLVQREEWSVAEPRSSGAHGSDGVWFVDSGLGDAIYEPMRLTAGVHKQGPFTYTIDENGLFHHDPSGTFASMRFEPAACRIEDFTASHEYLSTSPESPFTGTFTVQRRDVSGVDILRGCVLTRWDERGKNERVLESYELWCETLSGLFGIPAKGLEDLWQRVREAHEKWLMRQV